MIPDFQSIMRPLLELVMDGKNMNVAELHTALAKHFALSDDELKETQLHGVKKFYNRLGWVLTHLRKAGAIASPQRGVVHITERGKLLLSSVPGPLNMKSLSQFEEYCQFTNRPISQQVGDVVIPENDESNSATVSSAHQEIQYILLDLGSQMGMDVWVARNDRGRSFNGVSFASIKGMKSELPLQFDEVTMRTIELIDVLWLQGNAIVAAFEIESTTSIYSGLLRMADLISMQPNINIPLYLVAPGARRDKVFAEINRPTFKRLKPPLSQLCRYMEFSVIRARMSELSNVMKYLKADFLNEISEPCLID